MYDFGTKPDSLLDTVSGVCKVALAMNQENAHAMQRFNDVVRLREQKVGNLMMAKNQLAKYRENGPDVLRVARLAATLFDSPQQFRDAVNAYRYALTIGGLRRLSTIGDDHELANHDAKVTPDLRDYEDNVACLGMHVGCHVQCQIDNSTYALAQIVEPSDQTLPGEIRIKRYTFNIEQYISFPFYQAKWMFTMITGKNVQSVFDTLKKKWNLHNLSNFAHSYAYSTRSKDKNFDKYISDCRRIINSQPGLAGILTEEGSSTTPAAKKASSSGRGKRRLEPEADDEDEVKILSVTTKEQRTEEKMKNPENWVDVDS